ncbi:MAG: DnaJ domain-containing protein [Sulfurimonas sp.]|uniref:DnaJ domain-containing protein n=1 Tax=Sulfurimonas sp. TaxID=2022749 RepID=UPI0025EAE246|nr:DnaJ domain-containing protein [Sulfurimonas sp.]MCK9455187.1 DnaJ domain-containing protein [Sulfurimonas sp.]
MGNIIFLAILAGFFYWIFKSYSRYTHYSQEAFKNFSISKESLQNSELGLFVALVAKVAKADGRVDALEAQLIGIMFDDISALFPQPQKTKDILKEIFNEHKQSTQSAREIAAALAIKIKRDRAKQHQFMGFLIQLAFIDKVVSKSEEEMLASIAEALAFDPNSYHAMFDQFEKIMQNAAPKVNISDAYKLLGVSESDSMDVIKKAYRKLIREYHPDIIKSQGKDDAYMQEATRKTQEINEAYEMIKAHKK